MKAFLILCLATASAVSAAAGDTDRLRSELAQAERSFCAQAAKVGIADAFLANMADECFIADRLSLTRSEYQAAVLKARAKAGAAYTPGPNPNVQLTWSPSKVDVSADGTLGYTWGRYDYVSKGKDGKAETSTGIYMTVWKRQADGVWRFVYDGAPQIPDDPAALVAFLARPDLPSAGALGKAP
jgi:ketosteroid isomerase-like protein